MKHFQTRIFLACTVLMVLLSVSLTAGDRKKVKGVIVAQDGAMILVDDLKGTQHSFQIGPATKIGEQRRNIFREGKRYTRADLVRGLRVVVSGSSDDSGRLVADSVKMKNIDLKVASVADQRTTMLEGELTGQIDTLSGNVGHVSRQVEELDATSDKIREDARKAGRRLDQVEGGLEKTRQDVDANTRQARMLAGRVDALDAYRVVHTSTVYFAPASSKLTPEAAVELERIASMTKDQSGVLYEVTGFASSDGDAAYNRRLSGHRAEAVVQHLAEEYALPLRRFVRPHGFGEGMAVADNSTPDGRRMNRRVEVRVLLNEGISKDAMP